MPHLKFTRIIISHFIPLTNKKSNPTFLTSTPNLNLHQESTNTLKSKSIVPNFPRSSPILHSTCKKSNLFHLGNKISPNSTFTSPRAKNFKNPHKLTTHSTEITATPLEIQLKPLKSSMKASKPKKKKKKEIPTQ